jgi:hypothetical protein
MNLKSMIPFLDEEELHELCQKVSLSPTGEYQGVTMMSLLPFVEEEDVDRMMLAALKQNKPVDSFYPFASEKGLHQLVDQFLAGSPLENPIRLLPFLEEEDLQRIAEKIAKESGSYQGLRWSSLLPFMDEGSIDELFLLALQKEDARISVIVPFASDAALHQAVRLYLQGAIKEESMNAIYSFLDDEDLHLLFKAALHEAL